MLTDDDLTVIRAALLYFGEEVVLHGHAALTAYLDAPLGGKDPTVEQVMQLRVRLRCCQRRDVRCDDDALKVIEERWGPTAEEARSDKAGESASIATLLIPGET